MKNQLKSVTLYTARLYNNLCFIFILISTLSCRYQQGPQPPVIEPIPTVHHFDAFYQAFHEDTNYQLIHIRFPLEGEPEQSDPVAYNNTFHWEQDKWVWHKAFNEQDTLFTRHFEVYDSILIKETIFHRLSPMRLERRFAYNGSSWILIYYSPLRMPVSVEIN